MMNKSAVILALAALAPSNCLAFAPAALSRSSVVLADAKSPFDGFASSLGNNAFNQKKEQTQKPQEDVNLEAALEEEDLSATLEELNLLDEDDLEALSFAQATNDGIETEITTSSKKKNQFQQPNLQNIQNSVDDFVNDERVQEISAKAGAFAQDVLGKIFSSVGDKLKEIKQEKEERERMNQD